MDCRNVAIASGFAASRPRDPYGSGLVGLPPGREKVVLHLLLQGRPRDADPLGGIFADHVAHHFRRGLLQDLDPGMLLVSGGAVSDDHVRRQAGRRATTATPFLSRIASLYSPLATTIRSPARAFSSAFVMVGSSALPGSTTSGGRSSTVSGGAPPSTGDSTEKRAGSRLSRTAPSARP